MSVRRPGDMPNWPPLSSGPSTPPPQEPPAAMRPIQLPPPFQSHIDLEKQVYEKLGDILYKHHREMDGLPKLGGQSALVGEAVSEKEILEVMRDVANKFFTEMLAHKWPRRGRGCMQSW